MSIPVDIIIYICTFIASVATACGILTKIVHNTVTKISKEAIDNSINQSNSEIESKMSALNEKLESFIEKQHECDERVRKTLQASTRDRINQAHDIYMKQQFIGAHSLFVVEELYASYKELGGNSFIDKQMEDIRNLKVVSADSTYHTN